MIGLDEPGGIDHSGIDPGQPERCQPENNGDKGHRLRPPAGRPPIGGKLREAGQAQDGVSSGRTAASQARAWRYGGMTNIERRSQKHKRRNRVRRAARNTAARTPRTRADSDTPAASPRPRTRRPSLRPRGKREAPGRSGLRRAGRPPGSRAPRAGRRRWEDENRSRPFSESPRDSLPAAGGSSVPMAEPPREGRCPSCPSGPSPTRRIFQDSPRTWPGPTQESRRAGFGRETGTENSTSPNRPAAARRPGSEDDRRTPGLPPDRGAPAIMATVVGMASVPGRSAPWSGKTMATGEPRFRATRHRRCPSGRRRAARGDEVPDDELPSRIRTPRRLSA